MHVLHTIGWMNVLVQLISMISFISGLFQLDPYKLVAFLILVTVNVFGLKCVKIRGTATPPLETPITFPTVTSKERWELFDELYAWPLPQYPDCSSSGINIDFPCFATHYMECGLWSTTGLWATIVVWFMKIMSLQAIQTYPSEHSK